MGIYIYDVRPLSFFSYRPDLDRGLEKSGIEDPRTRKLDPISWAWEKATTASLNDLALFCPVQK